VDPENKKPVQLAPETGLLSRLFSGIFLYTGAGPSCDTVCNQAGARKLNLKSAPK